MTNISSASPNLAPTIDDQVRHGITDDECVMRLARAVDVHDDQRLQEVALLIGRLAVPIE